MTREDIKKIIEADPYMQWWSAVLFSEISELIDAIDGYNEKTILSLIKLKTQEFNTLFQQHSLNNLLKNENKLEDLEKRVSELEKINCTENSKKT